MHVPFCAVRCTYCDFSTGSLSAPAVERYLGAMCREADARAAVASGRVFHSVFFGGGTPSALPAAAFRRLWRTLVGRFAVARDAEITLEANPESVRDDRLEAWTACGVNRLSFGAQSFDPGELRALGRVHTAERPADAVALARAHGVQRLSLDLMFGFPGHTLASWARTLDRVLALELEHVSAYCFIPEPGTPLGDAVAAGTAVLPDDDEQAAAYERLDATVGEHGYACYETSNFCRPGGEARHNLVYWLRRPYLGLGPSAHGLWDGRRYGNAYAFGAWAAALERGERPEVEAEAETRESRAREIVMLGLRLACGLHAADYAPAAWRDVAQRYGRAFDRALASGRLERCARGLRIPSRLRFLADDVIARIEADAARAPFDSLSWASIIAAS